MQFSPFSSVRQYLAFVMKTNCLSKLMHLELTMQIFVAENHCITASSFKQISEAQKKKILKTLNIVCNIF